MSDSESEEQVVAAPPAKKGKVAAIQQKPAKSAPGYIFF